MTFKNYFWYVILIAVSLIVIIQIKGRGHKMTDTTAVTKIVNSFAKALIDVCKSMGIEISLDKTTISSDTHFPNNRVAALIGFVTPTVKGTIGLLVEESSFNEIVTVMSGGSIKPSLSDSLALSVIGELANITSGQAFIKYNASEISITPPQLLTGELIMAVPSAEDAVRSFTLPFTMHSGNKIYLVLTINA